MCAEFHGGALVAMCIAYVLTMALVLYAWTYTNPAVMQSDSLLYRMCVDACSSARLLLIPPDCSFVHNTEPRACVSVCAKSLWTSW